MVVATVVCDGVVCWGVRCTGAAAMWTETAPWLPVRARMTLLKKETGFSAEAREEKKEGFEAAAIAAV